MHFRISAAAVVASVALGACAVGPAPSGGASCVALFQRFDLLLTTVPEPQGRGRDGRAASSAVMAQADRLRRAGCITFSRDIAGMEALTGPPVTDSGPVIRPTGLHAGVVTSMEDDARARAFFESRGVRARSVGSATLGRRIYLGPFATQGALDAAAALAIEAGFAYPYPASF